MAATEGVEITMAAMVKTTLTSLKDGHGVKAHRTSLTRSVTIAIRRDTFRVSARISSRMEGVDVADMEGAEVAEIMAAKAVSITVGLSSASDVGKRATSPEIALRRTRGLRISAGVVVTTAIMVVVGVEAEADSRIMTGTALRTAIISIDTVDSPPSLAKGAAATTNTSEEVVTIGGHRLGMAAVRLPEEEVAPMTRMEELMEEVALTIMEEGTTVDVTWVHPIITGRAARETIATSTTMVEAPMAAVAITSIEGVAVAVTITSLALVPASSVARKATSHVNAPRTAIRGAMERDIAAAIGHSEEEEGVLTMVEGDKEAAMAAPEVAETTIIEELEMEEEEMTAGLAHRLEMQLLAVVIMTPRRPGKSRAMATLAGIVRRQLD